MNFLKNNTPKININELTLEELKEKIRPETNINEIKEEYERFVNDFLSTDNKQIKLLHEMIKEINKQQLLFHEKINLLEDQITIRLKNLI